MTRRALLVLPAIIFGFFGILPAMSLFELVTTGTIDLEAVGRGRMEIAQWKLYIVGWAVFLFFGAGYFPMLKYYREPEMFALSKEGIEIEGRLFSRDEILSIRNTWRGLRVETARQSYFFHVYAVPGASSALARMFPNFEIKTREAPIWLAGGRPTDGVF